MYIKSITLSTLFCLCTSLFAYSQDSLNMTLVGHWDDNALSTISGVQFNDIWGYADGSGNEFAIIGSTTHIIFIDVTDPSNPVEVDRIAGGGASVWRDIKTFGHYAYAVTDNGEHKKPWGI